jgi:puromycin-sensitive aminopeptidase
MSSKKLHSVLLPAHIIPTHYSIFLRPDLDNFTFDGSETINLEFLKPDAIITLHSAEIKISKAYVKIGNQETSSQRISYSKKEETTTIHFSKKLPKGKVSLTLEFNGILNDKMRGFYRSRYVLNAGCFLPDVMGLGLV